MDFHTNFVLTTFYPAKKKSSRGKRDYTPYRWSKWKTKTTAWAREKSAEFKKPLDATKEKKKAPKLSKTKLTKLISDIAGTLDDKEQENAIQESLEHINQGKQLMMLLHGPPGTGKTHVAGKIAECVKDMGFDVRCAALTGAAATHLPLGTTIQYLLGIKGIPTCDDRN